MKMKETVFMQQGQIKPLSGLLIHRVMPFCFLHFHPIGWPILLHPPRFKRLEVGHYIFGP
jgi:hypothetical protein